MLGECLGSFHPRVIFDIGSRDGNESMRFAERYPDARIFAFECHPELLPACRDALAPFRGIELVPRAVSLVTGRIPFFPIDHARSRVDSPDGNPGASSILRASGKYVCETYVQNEVTVPSTRLDHFCAQRGIAHPDLMWMDIQGAELDALRSLGARLASCSLLHVEVEFVEIYAGQALFPEVREYLEAGGWSFAGFTSYSRYFADAVFLNDRAFGRAALRCAKDVLGTARLIWKYRRHALKRRIRALAGLS
ncbi:MAG: hypothetical protein A3D95_00885 [Betaproteobacteria bacterium RIFCSPHIGHO2_12_FULL_69_13]|nr:MAG: hypothetical protein A3D95_00885 [Betaproteobacteria bacterium RIFCSPHIGHO2_12_FULL_69_13]OGA65732.1 MAG: hypothetical protein A3G83_02325 [Betaproteobacteria bacterium RIFCSPLOWO2_12_FULL_68_20]